MKYTIGTIIPAKEISKRFKDEDGEIFLELRGMKDVLFRVTDGDRVYYKIEKEKLKGEELTLVVDYTLVRPKPRSFQDAPTAKVKAITEETPEEIDVGTLWGTVPVVPKKVEEPEEKNQFEEGEILPEHLRDHCRKNDYGGYTFRYNKFLYMLDDKYLIEIKSPDTDTRYTLPMEELMAANPPDPWDTDTSDDIFDLTAPLPDSGAQAESRGETVTELHRGDILPARLRAQCEALLGYGFGSRITIGEYLYILDPHFMVVEKMKISYMDEGEKNMKKVSPPAAAEGHKSKSRDTEGATGTPLENTIANIANEIRQSLERYEIQAEYFSDTELIPARYEILTRTYQGDLEQLNDDTQEAAAQGKALILPEEEKGFNLLKAALIHEFYIKSTLSGRGEKAKYFLTHIAAIEPDGTVGELRDNLEIEEQKKMVEFFKNRSFAYPDKTDIIRRVHIQVRNSIFDQYRELVMNAEDIRFNALLICKLYENTTRLDRGDGITMMRLTRDLLDYRGD